MVFFRPQSISTRKGHVIQSSLQPSLKHQMGESSKFYLLICELSTICMILQFEVSSSSFTLVCTNVRNLQIGFCSAVKKKKKKKLLPSQSV